MSAVEHPKHYENNHNMINSSEEMVNHPKHYNSNPFGLETIDIVKHYNFCVGNALKYILRAGHKWNAIEDLKKAVWYLNQEIADRQTKDGN